MIEKLEISDYRSCAKTAIELQPDLSVLIGPNGSGKTSILNAFLLLRSLIGGRNFIGRGTEEAANESRLKATFRHNEKKSVLTANLQVHNDEHNDDVIVGSSESWYARDFTGNRRRITVPLAFARIMLDKEDPEIGYNPDISYLRAMRMHRSHAKFWGDIKVPSSFVDELSRIIDFLQDIKYYGASQFTNPSQCPVSFEVEQGVLRRSTVRLHRHRRFLFDLYGARETPTYIDFFNVVGPNGIGLVDKIEFKEIRTSSIDYSVRSGGKVKQRKQEKLLVIPQFFIGNDELSPSQLSEGTFKTITLLFYLITDKSSALLIEEPEVCVHHGLLSSIVELIKIYSKEKQIVISTHSDFILDQIEPRQVYSVSRTAEAGTIVTQITKSMSNRELNALKHYLEEEGNLGEYWRHGGLD